MAGYLELDDQETGILLVTSRKHKEWAALSLMARQLSCDAFAPGKVYQFAGLQGDTTGVRAHNLRQQLLGLAARGPKPALDLLSGGYYSEAFSLIRTVIEAWGRAVYVRLRPYEYHRWYLPGEPVLADADPIVPPLKEAPSFTGEVVQIVANEGENACRRIMEEAGLRYRMLSDIAHPSGEAIDQTWDEDGATLRFGPEYNRNLCNHGLNHLTFAQLALLRETSLLGEHSSDWRGAASVLDERWQPARESFKPLLEARRRLVQERQRAAQKKRLA
jgi:hypothetical protein